MTSAQEDVISRVKELLSEHFEAYIFTVEAEDESDGSDETGTFYGGGFNRCLGMANRQFARMEKTGAPEENPGRDSDDGEDWKETA